MLEELLPLKTLLIVSFYDATMAKTTKVKTSCVNWIYPFYSPVYKSCWMTLNKLSVNELSFGCNSAFQKEFDSI